MTTEVSTRRQGHQACSPLAIDVGLRLPRVQAGRLVVWTLLAAFELLCISPAIAQPAGAQTQPASPSLTWFQRLVDEDGVSGWLEKLRDQITSPLFWFGICAQAMFFARFVWQWIVSEKRGHSTIPIAFWYLSLAGGLAMFSYACLRADLVIMLGQLLACVIYIRNLMLIYRQAALRRSAGLPVVKLRSKVVGEDNNDTAP